MLGVGVCVLDGVCVGVAPKVLVGVIEGVGDGCTGGTFTPTTEFHTGISFCPYGLRASSKSNSFFFFINCAPAGLYVLPFHFIFFLWLKKGALYFKNP